MQIFENVEKKKLEAFLRILKGFKRMNSVIKIPKKTRHYFFVPKLILRDFNFPIFSNQYLKDFNVIF